MNEKKAVVVYVDDKPYLVHQAKALWASIQHIRCLNTDLVCFGPEQVLCQFLDHQNLIKIIQPTHRLSDLYGYINSIACFDKPEASFLKNYGMILKTDVDTFLTPSWLQYKPGSFCFGRGKYVHDEITKKSIQELASNFKLLHRGVHNIGSTFAGSADDVIKVCKLATQLTEHLIEVTF